MLAKNEADASVTEGINALTELAQIEECERSGEGPGMRDRKRDRAERMGDRKAKRIRQTSNDCRHNQSRGS